LANILSEGSFYCKNFRLIGADTPQQFSQEAPVWTCPSTRHRR